jgi:rubrerythrin
MAAMLAEEAEVTRKPIYHLDGGILAWDGRTVADHPRVAVFGEGEPAEALMARAMALEKGAFVFYRRLAEAYPEASFAPVIRQLEKAEEAHARLVHRFWSRMTADAPAFEAHFDALEGDILEGGFPLEAAIDRITRVATRQCLTVLEFALDIECAAYDLYRHMADTGAEEAAREAFYGIAQAEKAHMRQLATAIEACEDNR